MKDQGGLDKVIINLLAQIDAGRSAVSALPGLDMYSPQYPTGSGQSESPLNTFYRLVGLPAVRSPVPGQETFVAGQLSYDDSINLIDAGVLAAGTADAVLRRELSFQQSLGGEVRPTAANIEAGLMFVHEPLNLDQSAVQIKVRRKSGNQPIAVRKNIFPLVVCGDVPVFPVSRRTAPIFGPSVGPGGVTLTKTLLETVLYTRLAGTQDPAVRESVGNFQQKLLTNMIEAIGILATSYKSYVELLNRLSKAVIYVPAVRRGSRPQTNYGILDIDFTQYSEYFLDPPVQPALDSQLQAANTKVLEAQAVYGLLPTTAPTSEDTYSAGGTSVPATGAFFTDLLDFAGYRGPDAAAAVTSLEAQIKSELARADGLRARADMIAGESAGVGAIDVLAVFCAIYDQPDDVLVGLLNNQARDRLAVAIGRQPPAAVPTSQALAALESSVTKYLALAQTKYLPTNGDKAK